MEYDERIERLMDKYYDYIVDMIADEGEMDLGGSDWGDLVREWAYTHKEQILELEEAHE
ncbi:hypothetical protein [Lactiplantibacillus plantarum]